MVANIVAAAVAASVAAAADEVVVVVVEEEEEEEEDDEANTLVSTVAGSKAGMASVSGSLPSSALTTIATERAVVVGVSGTGDPAGGGVASHKDMGARRPGHGMG